MRQAGHGRSKGETMKLARTLACGAATLCFAASVALAADSDSSSGGIGASSDPSLEESDTLILLEPVEIQNLYGVDEDDDGLIDYLILEEGAA
jgi:hypothetical protein